MTDTKPEHTVRLTYYHSFPPRVASARVKKKKKHPLTGKLWHETDRDVLGG